MFKLSLTNWLLLLFLVNLSIQDDDCVIDLSNGTSWTLIEATGRVISRMQIPGGVYSTLDQNGWLNESVGRNSGDEDDRWVSKLIWDVQTAVYLTQCTRNSDLYLELDGVDTIAEIYFRGLKVNSTDNMFTKYKFKLDAIGKEPYQIAIRLHSPPLLAERYFNKYKELTNVTMPPSVITKEYRGESHVNLLRKMQASFAWDWGPAYPSVGLWKNARLTSFNRNNLVKVNDILSLPFFDKLTSKWKINVEIVCETAKSPDDIAKVLNDSPIQIDLFLNNSTVSSFEIAQVDSQSVEFISRQNYFELVIRKEVTVDEDVELWWPRGSGLDENKYKPTLYQLKGNLKYNYNGQQVSHSVSRKIGFRTVEVIQEDVKPRGKTFYFEVNSVPLFMKGSNWIPADILPEKSYDKKKINKLLTDAAEANMNALRVWGGGLYESDYFYDLADELGIFIWQDFMFACAMYPTNKLFLQSVSTEIEQQVQRLKSHPSILIWAGNNENEAALQQNWYPETKGNHEVYEQDYRKLYIETIKPIVERLDATRIFVASSPSNMDNSAAQGWLADNPSDPAYGDVHYYNYNDDSWNVSIYPSARFVSEYGFQSWPVYESWIEVIDNTSCLTYPLEECVSRRQHHPNGDNELISSIKRHFKWRPDIPFNKLMLWSQFDQAVAIKTESEFYRRNRAIDSNTGLGKTMGALYWQLNDVWVAPSWASIDNTGRWKALHFYAKKFFAPILLSLVRSGNEIEVHAVNDLVEQSEELTVTLQIFRLNQKDNLTPLSELKSKPLKLQPSTVKVVLKNSLPSDRSPGLIARVFASKADGSKFAENWLLIDPLSAIENPTPAQITLRQERVSDKVIKLKLTTDAIGTFVWIGPDRNNGRFSDNGFFLFEKEKEVLFTYNSDETILQPMDWQVIHS